MKQKWVVAAVAAAFLATGLVVGLWWWRTAQPGCVEGPAPGVLVCAASDMPRLTNHDRVPDDGQDFALSQGGIFLRGARNEVLGFQLIFQGKEPTRLTFEVSDLQGPGGVVIPAATHVRRFLANYVWVEPGGFTWGTPTEVLPWPDFYPDALVPFETRCGQTRTVIKDFEVPSKHGRNQNAWVDLTIPRNVPAGLYHGKVVVKDARSDRSLTVALNVEVWNVTLPDETSIDAVGEIYDPYVQEGLGREALDDEKWRRMSGCVQQMAHRHRMVFIERFDGVAGPSKDNPDPKAWEGYVETFGPALDGSLFTPERGYHGPGKGVPVAVWRTPWPQPYNGALSGPLGAQEVASYQDLAGRWGALVKAQRWERTRWFAYIFDEVDGPQDSGYAAGADGVDTTADAYIRMVHGEMGKVQDALDAGSGAQVPIELFWTSHSDPSQWGDEGPASLVDKVGLWAPNAGAANVDYLKARQRSGEQIWFYHDGHPFVGAHSINADGIEMRTWGVITARYGFDGHFMWAVNLSDPENPYHKPSYKSGDDRFGNGTLFYPGAKLTSVGYDAIEEPVESMRMKAWRRGLQDAELVLLARQRAGDEAVDGLLEAMVPVALSQATGDASWERSSVAWQAFHAKLLELAQRR